MKVKVYNEILRLGEMLRQANIPHELHPLYEGYTILYPNYEKCICSIIEHDSSYGNSEDKLEIMGLLTQEEIYYDDVVGHLTAEDVFNRIKNHWENN